MRDLNEFIKDCQAFGRVLLIIGLIVSGLICYGYIFKVLIEEFADFEDQTEIIQTFDQKTR